MKSKPTPNPTTIRNNSETAPAAPKTADTTDTTADTVTTDTTDTPAQQAAKIEWSNAIGAFARLTCQCVDEDLASFARDLVEKLRRVFDDGGVVLFESRRPTAEALELFAYLAQAENWQGAPAACAAGSALPILTRGVAQERLPKVFAQIEARTLTALCESVADTAAHWHADEEVKP